MQFLLHRVTSRYIEDEAEMENASRAAVGKILSVETVSVEIGAFAADSAGTARAKTPLGAARLTAFRVLQLEP
jgi:hypothetical protein